MAYDKEYFYSFDDYQKLQQNQAVGMKSYGDVKFDFYEIKFENNVQVYLFNSLKECIAFKNYCGFQRVSFIGEIKDMENRTIFEATNRTSKDFIDLCTQLAEERTYCFLHVPFKLSWEVNPQEELEQLRAKMK